jgi:hypothetical protein
VMINDHSTRQVTCPHDSQNLLPDDISVPTLSSDPKKSRVTIGNVGRRSVRLIP